MVSVRKSHQMTLTSFTQWLDTLSLSFEKKNALALLWQQHYTLFSQHNECETKALEMVEILASLNLDKDSLCAAIIIPLIEYQLITLSTVQETYSKDIYLLCKGVSQMDAIKTLQQTQSSNVSVNQVDNIRRMLLAMVEDVRAVVIKLAERLVHLRLVKNADEENRVLAAKETANIYAPLANRLGIGQLKWELEDISFRYLHPNTYMKIAKLLDEKRLDREKYMVDFVASLTHKIAETGIIGEVYGRPKHIYSIWKKMQKKSLDFDQLFDVRAVRVVVDKLQDCYGALGIVHTNWKHLPNEFDDYVATPKTNGYQSIHTVVYGPEGKTIEIQIRTKQMHDDAELGVAAHWRYKEGTASGKSTGFDEKVSWLRKILQWQEDVTESGELLDELRSQVFEDRIYVFTPNGDVIDLPTGATPLDFAYYIHSNVGHCCIGAKVFGRIVPFTHQLHTGDQVEILTSKTPNPSRDWLNPSLNYLHTPRARAKVQHFFKLQDRDKHISLGKEQLELELTKFNCEKADLSAVCQRFNVNNTEELYASIGSGNARLQQVVNFIVAQEEKHKGVSEIDPQSLVKQSPTHQQLKADKNGITVSGVGNLLTHMAKCCQPVPGDDIVGFITQGRGISIHRSDCEQFSHLLTQHPEREVEVQWGEHDSTSYQVSLLVTAYDRQGLLRDISTIVANERLLIIGFESKSDRNEHTTTMTIQLEVSHQERLQKLIAKFSQLDDVIEVKRK
ncbi:GTP diphosphokinase [Thalassotalea sp. 1_MG-2023]|uniref:GTP diphosphokinase n=1 Tax=Thalassotalea sp. 1_MG-2023 TaxID=3062680 RepID=UPI0026E38C34|nr:GTP diphosphokinase [Thalassotalea sp. 1_MG-2023]MDO6427409.1 GTP diphosphokinase [Thalassotalea sp. 1_MG-2023]